MMPMLKCGYKQGEKWEFLKIMSKCQNKHFESNILSRKDANSTLN